MESGPVTMPLHLRITAWHDDQLCSWSATRLDIGEIKTVLVPRQALLHELDPSGELPVPVRTRLEPMVCQYEKLILHDKVDQGFGRAQATSTDSGALVRRESHRLQGHVPAGLRTDSGIAT